MLLLRLETHYLQTKPPSKKPVLEQTEWWIQNGIITKNGLVPVTTFIFFENFVSVYHELIWCTNYPNVSTLCLGSFISKPKEGAQVLLKIGTRDFKIVFGLRDGMFLCDNNCRF